MGTRQGDKLASHVAPDSISDFSVDSLSFAGLVCVQEQQPKPSVPNQHEHYQYQLSKHDQDFEFATIKTDLNSAANPMIRITPADALISNGQIIPQALASQPNRPFIRSPPCSLRTLLAIDHIGSNRMSNGQTSSSRKYHEQPGKARNNTNKDRTARLGFGQKMFRSFLSPCRKCKAIQPGAVKSSRRKSSKYSESLSL